MFEIDGKSYALKYNMDRVEMIENSIGMPTMAELYSHKGMLSLSALKAYLAHGLKEEGSDSFVPVKKGLEMAKNLIQNEGYTNTCGAVVEALERDCPFFFREN